MSKHECHDMHGGPCELAYCVTHPKWNVVHARSQGNVGRRWFVYAPLTVAAGPVFATWREAFDYAREQATR